MLLVLIRIVAVIIGTMFFLPAFPVVLFGSEKTFGCFPLAFLMACSGHGSFLLDGMAHGQGNHRRTSRVLPRACLTLAEAG
jgi:hypothetical protein